MQILRQLSVGPRLAIAFGLVLALVALVSLAGITQMGEIHKQTQRIVDREYVRVRLVNEMQDAVRYQSVAIRDVVLQGDLSFMMSEVKRIKEARARYTEAAQALRALVDESLDQSQLTRILSDEKAVQPILTKVLDHSISDESEEAAEVIRDELRDAQIALLESLNTMLTGLEERAAQSAATAAQAYQSGRFLVISLTAVAFVLGIIGSYAISRSIVRPLADASRVVSTVAEGDLRLSLESQTGKDEAAQVLSAMHVMVDNLKMMFSRVAETANQVGGAALSMKQVTTEAQEGTDRQEKEIGQVATAMTEMAASAREVSESARGAADAAELARVESSSGSGIVQETAESINVLAGEVERTAEALSTLQSDTTNIGLILDVIKGIAEQTNLLALNAAIEAARAGEQGRGFAVVADEVRTLAGKTQESTQEIETMIERLQNGAVAAVQVMEGSRERAQESVSKAETAGASLTKIAEAVASISTMTVQIAAAAVEQSTVAESINENVSRISQVAEESTKRAQSTTAAGQHLETLAEELTSTVTSFRT